MTFMYILYLKNLWSPTILMNEPSFHSHVKMRAPFQAQTSSMQYPHGCGPPYLVGTEHSAGALTRHTPDLPHRAPEARGSQSANPVASMHTARSGSGTAAAP